MRNKLEVPYYVLHRKCNYKSWPFRFASQMAAPVEVIGQEKAEKAFDMGLEIEHPFYNIYVTGASGTGKVKNTLRKVKVFASKGQRTGDWCYVYNFEDSRRPIALSFKPGEGKEFRKAVRSTVGKIREGILDLKGNRIYQLELKHLLSEYNRQKGEILERLKHKTGRNRFEIKAGEEGLIFYPIKDGKVMSSEEYQNLEESERQNIEKQINEFYEEIFYTLEQLRDLEKEYKQKVRDIQTIHVRALTEDHFRLMYEKYGQDGKVLSYLKKLQKDIINNFLKLIDDEHDFNIRYEVNLLVDNSQQEGRPVVFETNPTIRNLLGQIEFRNVEGNLFTDLTMLRAGALHRACGGYLIIPVRELLLHYDSWNALKLCLKKGEIDYRYSSYISGNLPVDALYPQPIPLKVKVILIGEEEVFEYLSCYDPDFSRLFKIKVDYRPEVERTFSTEMQIASYIGHQVIVNDMLDFHRSAVAALIEFSSRLAGKQNKLSTGLDHIFDLMVEAEACASREGSRVVEACHVRKALKLRDERGNRVEQKVMEMYKDNILLLNVGGERIGEINGLSIVNDGEYSFGRAYRITATCFRGGKGIINIEREIKNSGSAHSKGVLILEGYLMEKYATGGVPCITINICFEQLYGCIKEDSLSAAELLAVLSVIGEIPLKQSIAVTGSVNQRGEIQPVTRINERIEGFFEICLSKNCREIPGVIIPRQNLSNLNLKEEIVEAVKRRKFRIYSVEHVDQALEIMTGLKAGSRNRNGEFPPGTAGYLIRKRMKGFFE